MISSIKFKSKTDAVTSFYLPDECWEHVFEFILDYDNNNRHYFEPISLVSKQFLSITNRLRFSLTICDPTVPFIPRLFQRFPNLTSLDFTRFSRDGNLDALLCEISCFPQIDNLNLKSLKFSNQTKIPTNGLLVLSKKITTLISLTCSKIYSRSDKDLVNISNCFPFLEQFDLSNRKPYYSHITDVGVDSMSSALPKLRKVNLSSLYDIHDSTLFNLCKNCEFLEELKILKCPYLTPDGVASALRERPTLKSVSFGWLAYGSHDIITSHFIDSLVGLKGLTCLHLMGLKISDKLLTSIAEKGLPLRRLVLQNCRCYKYAEISYLLSKCQCIQHLNLQNAKFMSDQRFAELSMFLGDLVSINLSGCSKLTDSTFLALTGKCPSLNEIKMESTGIGEKRVEDSNSAMNLVINPQLKSLHLAYNEHLRDENIIMFSSICPNLEFLDLSYCKGISEGIGEVLRCCKIRHLNLAGCSGLKLDGINFKVSTLEVLNLSNSKVDDISLYTISKSCFGLLQLNLRCCCDVTEKGVWKVVEKCTKLREINLEYCSKVDANVVEWLVDMRPSLRKITAPPYFFSTNRKRKKVFLHHGCLIC